MNIYDKILDCRKITNQIHEDLRNKISQYEDIPVLAIIKVGHDNGSDSYLKSIERTLNHCNVGYEVIELEESADTDDIVQAINVFNQNEQVHGILIQFPLPKHIDIKTVSRAIAREKDVDGIHPYNAGMLYTDNGFIGGRIPCTALGILELLKKNEIDLCGKNVTIIGRSNIVGKPLASLMIRENATVTICHSKTKNLSDITKNADIIISCAGVPNLITKDNIKDGAIIVDVGVNYYNGKLCGDVDFDSVIEKCDKATIVPGGIGLLTTTFLAFNCFQCYKIYGRPKKSKEVSESES